MQLTDIHIRDPFILAEDGVYYMYGSRCAQNGDFSFVGKGLDVYTSRDLVTWSEAQECFTRPDGFWADRDFWAPEVHRYKGAYYMFVSFKSPARCRGTQILRVKSPMGPFLPISEGPVTPRDWECLDGTLHVDADGRPWMVFCHEWVQIHNGTVCAMPLTEDLAAPAGAPQLLFSAHDAPWVRSVLEEDGHYVTDGPFLRRDAQGTLWLLWSSFTGPGCYAQTMARSESGTVLGPWQHAAQPLFSLDGGHGMLFDDFAGNTWLVLHSPNSRGLERPHLFLVQSTPEGFALAEQGAHG